MRTSRCQRPEGRRGLFVEESGQTMAEYATVLAIIVVAVIVVLSTLALGVNAAMQRDVTTILTGL